MIIGSRRKTSDICNKPIMAAVIYIHVSMRLLFSNIELVDDEAVIQRDHFHQFKC